jgi:hypothetical protein
MMADDILCPNCKKGPMRWLDPDREDVFENVTMECQNCKAQYKGFPEWSKAMGVKIQYEP